MNFTEMTSRQLIDLGFRWWDKHGGLLLIPHSLLHEVGNRIPIGTELKTISGGVAIVGVDAIDPDHRMGLLAYGWIPVDCQTCDRHPTDCPHCTCGRLPDTL